MYTHLAVLSQGLRGLEWIQCTGGRQPGEGAPANICCMFHRRIWQIRENLADVRIAIEYPRMRKNT